MSQGYSGDGCSSSSGAGEGSSTRPSNNRSQTNPVSPISVRPEYMTVGTGSTSPSAHALMESLDFDSGYGGSITGDMPAWGGDGRGWHPGLTADQPTPSHTPVQAGESNAACMSILGGLPSGKEVANIDCAAENERRILASHVHQLY